MKEKDSRLKRVQTFNLFLEYQYLIDSIEFRQVSNQLVERQILNSKSNEYYFPVVINNKIHECWIIPNFYFGDDMLRSICLNFPRVSSMCNDNDIPDAQGYYYNCPESNVDVNEKEIVSFFKKKYGQPTKVKMKEYVAGPKKYIWLDRLRAIDVEFRLIGKESIKWTRDPLLIKYILQT